MKCSKCNAVKTESYDTGDECFECYCDKLRELLNESKGKIFYIIDEHQLELIYKAMVEEARKYLKNNE